MTTQSPTGLNSLFSGDTGQLPMDTRAVLVRLERGPYFDGRQHPELWIALLRDKSVLRQRLNEKFLELVLDEQQQVAFARQVRDPDLDPPLLMRRIRLTFLETALLLYLRKELNNVDQAEGVAIVGDDDIRTYLAAFHKQDRSDEVAFNKKVGSSISKMVSANILKPISTEGRYQISPVLRLRFTAEEVRAVAEQYDKLAKQGGDSDG